MGRRPQAPTPAPKRKGGGSPKTARTPEKLEIFLQHLERNANVTESARLAKISRTEVYEARNADEAFAARWLAAWSKGIDGLEDEASRRGVTGVRKPVYQGGKLVGYVQEYSDTLLIFMLKARRPDVFKDRSATEHSGTLTLEQLVLGSMDPKPKG